MSRLSRALIFKGAALVAIVGLSIGAPAQCLAQPKPTAEHVLDSSATVPVEIPLAELGQTCLLGEPPVGKCDMLKQAYCRALADCTGKPRKEGVTVSAAKAGGKAAGAAADNKSAHEAGIKFPGLPFPPPPIEYLCLAQLGCND